MSSLRPLLALVIAARERLIRAGLGPDSAAIDAEVLAREALGWDRARYLQRRDEPSPPAFAERYEALVARREAREPVSQILGRREFYGRDFIVTSDVLTPRPETELIVDAALARWPAGTSGPGPAVDVGTGSGCLAITLACEWPGARVAATDISAAALDVASRNRQQHEVTDRVLLVRTDLLSAMRPGLMLIVANPPYVPEPAGAVLSPEVRVYEPAPALFGGPTGFEIIERLLDQSTAKLAAGGLLLMEFGAGQDDAVGEIVARRNSLELIEIVNDLQEIPRVAVVKRR